MDITTCEVNMENIKIDKNAELLDFARELRRNMTPQERHLWYDFLRNYEVNVYKQRIINNYIADFYCHAARLVIELDGSQHYTPEGRSYDEARTDVIERYGIEVIRFANADVDDNFYGVCYVIDKKIKERIALFNDV